MRAASIKEPVDSEIKASYLVDADTHRWLIPAAAMEVCLHAEALAGLARDLAVVRKRARPGEEIGGLLVGCRDFIGRNSVRISNIETYSASTLHPLLGLTCVKLAEQRAQDEAETSVVGWYRIASREEAGFSREDEALMRMHFPDPGSVLLLLRPSELHLVFWRGNELKHAAAEFAALPILLAPAPAPAPQEPPRRATRSRRIWGLAGISLLTAALAFTAGILWNQSVVKPQPVAAIVQPEPPASEPAPAEKPTPFDPPVSPAPAGLLPAGPKTPPAPVESAHRVFVPPPQPQPRTAADPALPPPAPAVAAAPSAAIPKLPVPVVDQPPQPPPAPPVAKKQQTEAPPVPVLRPAAPIQKIDPAPPPAAKRLTQAITIQVRLTVDPNGDVVDAEALGVKGDVAAQLARAAIDAGRRWKFTPALLSGHPVLSTTTVQFVFRPAR